MAGTYLLRTFGTPDGPGGGTFIWTMSAWVKKTGTGGDVGIMTRYVNSGKYVKIFFNSDDQLEYAVYNSSYQARYQTSARYRDTNGWYHIVVAQNSTLATAADRVKIYVNGELITSFAVNTQIGQNIGGDFNTASAPHQIGAYNATQFFNGLMSAFNFIDNTQYAASDFGSTDATTGQWKINTAPSVTYGATGFSILNNGNTITDQSTNSNNWSEEGTPGIVSNTKDCPSNVFTTLNVLERLGSSITVSNGNTQFFNQASDWRTMISNLAFPNTGKFYAEMQVNEVSSAVQVGIMAQSSFTSHFQADLGTQGQYNSYAYLNTGQKRTNSSTTSYGDSFAGGIIGIAVDMDNKNIYFAKDGVWQNSGNPESGATGTGAAFTDLQNDKSYCFAVASQGSNPKVSWNFGNGTFGTTAVTSAGTAGSTPGTFEYNVPSGYEPLTTKGLNA